MVIISSIFVPSRKVGYDILGESSPVPSKVLCPAEKLQWNLSTEITNDILTAKKNLDEYVIKIPLIIAKVGEILLLRLSKDWDTHSDS